MEWRLLKECKMHSVSVIKPVRQSATKPTGTKPARLNRLDSHETGRLSDLLSGACEHVGIGGVSAQSISVIVPVYNSEATIPELVRRLEPVLTALSRKFELLLVNDGSYDQSWSAIEKIAAGNHWVRGINLMRNFGQHNALLCGIRAAACDIIVTIDDDLQNPPEEIPKLVAKLAEHFDVVYGYPERPQHGLLRNLASSLTKMALQNSMGVETARRISAFRAFRAQLRDAFAKYHSPFVSIDVILTWGSNRFTAINVQHDARAGGSSNYTIRKLFTHAMNMMTGFSILPLQLSNLVGFLCTGFGVLLLGYVVGRYLLYGTNVPGFTFLASVISIFSGAQLFALGIIGEYLSRIHFRTMERPTYAVKGCTLTVDCESK